jgi:nucleotide-binding universal stress UspA family protein
MRSPPFGGFLASEDDPADGAPLVAGGFDGGHILVPLLTSEVPVLTDQLKIAITLARETGASVTVVNPLTVPDQPPKTYHRDVVDNDDTALLEWVFEHAAESLPEVDGDLVYARNVVRGVLRAVRRREVDTLVVPGQSSSTRLRAGVTEQLAAHADADIVVVNGQAGFRTAASILLPVADGPHSGLAADVAAAIAADCDAWIDVLHVVDGDATERRRERADELVEGIARRIARPETTTTWVLDAGDATEAIVEQSRYYDLTILGAPTKGRLRRLIFGSTNSSVRANANSVVLSACNNAPRSDAE